jgi:polysaccharide export outer membrane protein
MSGSRTNRRALFAGLALAGATGCGPSIYETYDYGKEYDPRKHEYIIGVSDLVNISVYHTPDLSGGGTVRPDGVLTLPLIGELTVAGKTPTQVKEEMKKRVATYVKSDPVVNVTVSGFNSYRFVVTGNVGHAGALQQKFFITLSEALAMGGGPSKFAGDSIIVFRKDAKQHVREIPISYKMLISGKHPEMDIAVVSGDSIVVY